MRTLALVATVVLVANSVRTALASDEIRFTVVNRTTPTFTVVANKVTQDPYRMEYREFHEWIRSGGRGVLVVGIPDRYVGSYETHCWVPSGFGGLRDGDYDCWYADGDNRMSPRKVAAPEVAPARFFPTRTPAQPAGAFSTPSPAGTVTVHTRIAVPWTAPFGATNCPASG